MNFIDAVGDWKSNDEWQYADKEAAWKFFFAAGKESSQAVISAQCVKMSQYESIIFELRAQLVAEQLNNKLLRDALQEYIDEHEECQDADDWMAMMCSVEARHTADEAIAQPSDTSALDSFVDEKVKEADDQILAAKNLLAIMHRDGGHHEFAVGFDQAIQDAMAVYYELTRQRDLAVEALHYCVKQVPELATFPGIASALKESGDKP